jgi:protein SCO1/2
MNLLERYLVCALLLAASSTLCADKFSLPYYSDTTLGPVWIEASGQLPTHRMDDFELLNQAGDAVMSESVSGKIRIINFFFATCPGICPMTMFNLRRVQDAIDGHSAQLLSFSITPLIDTPTKLSEYAETHKISQQRWQLLTGDEEQIEALARETFFAVLDRNVKSGSMSHTEKAYLVDRAGYIRGVYNATSVADIMRLVEDLELLQVEGDLSLSAP